MSASMSLDHSGLGVLPVQECLRRIGYVSVGRVAFVNLGEPVILPVNHAMDGDVVVFRTAAGSKFTAACDELPVAFEVDSYEHSIRDGWSVVVQGTATLVESEDEIARLNLLGLEPWADLRERPHWVRIRAYSITGREVIHPVRLSR
jgi:nitroimidazol reductase NimA-like FMN-containing flavoprotein (pyridoxamine 5'-phosphate oxidase superfamily)